MKWYQYSCCGRTFIRQTSLMHEPMPCPACFRLATPFVSCHILPLARINRSAKVSVAPADLGQLALEDGALSPSG